MKYEQLRELCRKELEKKPPEEIMEYAIAGLMMATVISTKVIRALNKIKQNENEI